VDHEVDERWCNATEPWRHCARRAAGKAAVVDARDLALADKPGALRDEGDVAVPRPLRRVGGAEVMTVIFHGEEAVEGEVVVVLGQAVGRHGVCAARAAARAVLRDPPAAGNRRFWPLSALRAHTKAP
jgi:hypothetical protein